MDGATVRAGSPRLLRRSSLRAQVAGRSAPHHAPSLLHLHTKHVSTRRNHDRRSRQVHPRRHAAKTDAKRIKDTLKAFHEEHYKPHVVSIDPNLSDLLYCVNGDTKEQTKFRYTQDTRRKETKAKKYRNYLQQRKQEMVDGKRVVEWEAELSAYNRKTMDFERFKAYIQKKNEINARLAPFYNRYIFHFSQAQAGKLHAASDHGSPSAGAV